MLQTPHWRLTAPFKPLVPQAYMLSHFVSKVVSDSKQAAALQAFTPTPHQGLARAVDTLLARLL